jgi:outer membrane lipoprotein-sorting protein
MTAVGDTLELMHSAYGRSKSIRAVVRVWTDIKLSRESWSRLATSPASAEGAEPNRPGAAPAGAFERVYRVWWEPERWRVEYDGDFGAVVHIVDGAAWWHHDARHGTFTNAGKDLGQRSAVDTVLLVIIDPALVIPEIELNVTGEGRHVGRLVTDIEAWPRRSDPGLPHVLPTVWPLADRYKVGVDAERGILMYYQAYLGSAVFIDNYVSDIAFDEPFPEGTFETLAPLGT